MTGFGKLFFNTSDKKQYIGQFFNGNINGNGAFLTENYIYRGLV